MALQPVKGSILSQDTTLPAGTQAGDWPMFGHDIRGTRSNPYETLIGPKMSVS